jgi:hypothetical protein
MPAQLHPLFGASLQTLVANRPNFGTKEGQAPGHQPYDFQNAKPKYNRLNEEGIRNAVVNYGQLSAYNNMIQSYSLPKTGYGNSSSLISNAYRRN